ncbi:hypothetical protein NMK71_10915 [Weeksellaceae bacterium KMM 9713]|uniref:Uncharacterized protein n=1 Tax=Profundicola chukchiensis TaxID=2961959 RepID=A0A9X4MZ70_9FLAO|nr:hypothetical protein [Profundicola chukchiensis]MDG4946923.1 hypothetical protein [Profundicola chukchiensis]
MKTLFIIIFILSAPFIVAQVAIGKDDVEGSAVLDFASNTQQGIILPWITESSIAETGSLIYSVEEKKVKFFNGSIWQDLSVKQGEVDTTEIDGFDEVGAGVLLGNENSTLQGVLVLDDNSKALVLPKSNQPWLNIKNPEAGTLVYDSENKLICIFNGLEWTFWGH